MITFQKAYFWWFRNIKNTTFETVPFPLSKKYCFEKYNFLTFNINEIDAFQKVIIFEESETLPGGKTFGGIQKVYVLKTNVFRKSIKKYMDFHGFRNKEMFEFPMILDDSQKMHVLKTNVFWNPIQNIMEFHCFWNTKHHLV